MPEVSIIVPFHNVAPWLRPCLDSILAQSFSDYELILIDDGSQDGCGAISDEYAAKDPRIRVIHQEYEGVSAARNIGLANASGQYITFVDSDDLIAPDYLSRMMRLIQEKNVTLVLCRLQAFKDGQDPDVCSGIDAFNPTRITTGRQLCVDRFDPENHILIGPCGKLYLRSLFDGLEFPAGRIHEDQYVIPIVMYKAERAAFLDAQLYFYRHRSGSITGSGVNLSSFDNIPGMDRVIAFYSAKGDRELVRLAKKHRENTLAELTVQAKLQGMEDIPESCKMSLFKALRIVHRKTGEEKYEYYLYQIFPKRLKPYRYWKKVKSLLHPVRRSSS